MTHDNNTNYYKFWKDCVEFKAMLVVLCVCVCVAYNRTIKKV